MLIKIVNTVNTIESNKNTRNNLGKVWGYEEGYAANRRPVYTCEVTLLFFTRCHGGFY